jgi:SEC-C motif-containing protein
MHCSFKKYRITIFKVSYFTQFIKEMFIRTLRRSKRFITTIGNIAMLCPCGSTLLFSACCQRLITHKQRPSTAEKLMRSRFSAYAVKEGKYIYETYGSNQKSKQSVRDIQSWADECIWIALVIHDVEPKVVEFSAFYIANNVLCELRERSNFIIEQDEWRYTDGEITVNEELAKVKRNDVCPCNNYPTSWSIKKNKKFKHCCAN